MCASAKRPSWPSIGRPLCRRCFRPLRPGLAPWGHSPPGARSPGRELGVEPPGLRRSRVRRNQLSAVTELEINAEVAQARRQADRAAVAGASDLSSTDDLYQAAALIQH